MSKVTIKEVNTYLKQYNKRPTFFEHTFELNGEKFFTAKIKTFLNVDEQQAFVDRVANGCFDSVTGEYMPALFNLLFDESIIFYLTDIPMIGRVDKESGQKTIDHYATYELCQGLKLSCLNDNLEYSELIEHLLNMCFEQVEYLKEVYVKKHDNLYRIVGTLNTILENMDSNELLAKLFQDESYAAVLEELVEFNNNREERMEQAKIEAKKKTSQK